MKDIALLYTHNACMSLILNGEVSSLIPTHTRPTVLAVALSNGFLCREMQNLENLFGKYETCNHSNFEANSCVSHPVTGRQFA